MRARAEVRGRTLTSPSAHPRARSPQSRCKRAASPQTTLVSRSVDPDSDAGLDHLRDLAAAPRRVTVDLPDGPIAVGHHAFIPAPLPDVLTPAQAAALLQVPEPELLELAEAGALPGRRIGHHWRFSRPALIAWLAGS